MPLTPQEVQAKVFGPTRFRRGYDETEVDGFLDDVEAELTRLHREIDQLRGQLGKAQGGSAGSSSSVEVAQAEPVDPEPMGAPPQQVAPAQGQVARSSGELVTAGSPQGGDVEQQVARTLVLAQRAADEAVRDAEAQAERTIREAHAEAERILAGAQQEASEQRSAFAKDRTQLQDDVDQLRSFEQEYRTRLRAYLEMQLRDLDAGDSGSLEAGAPAAVAAGQGAGDGKRALTQQTTFITKSGVGSAEGGEEPHRELRSLHDEL